MRTPMILALALTAGAAQAASPTLPNGTFNGTAQWRGPGGSTGTYAVEKSIEGATMTARYTWQDQGARQETHTVTFAAKAGEPMFDVLDAQGNVVGKGYCYDDACTYRAAFGPVTVDESIRWADGTMNVLGAKSGPGFTVVWKETLRSR